MILLLLSLTTNNFMGTICQSCKLDANPEYLKGFVKNKHLEEQRFQFLAKRKANEIFFAKIFYSVLSNHENLGELLKVQEIRYKNKLDIYYKTNVVSGLCQNIDFLKKLFNYPDLFVELFKARSEVVDTLVENLDCNKESDCQFLRDFIKKFGTSLENNERDTIISCALIERNTGLIDFLIKEREKEISLV